MGSPQPIDVGTLSPLAWRLLRVAAGYDQRAVEREVDGVLQAHVSMLERGTRALSLSRRRTLFELYAADLTPEQIEAIAKNF
ncbi:hypothetical protein ACFQPA_02230 [Halomarina halobia]|uniref:Helix-turn-helix domain-containing protein n=1 Tax=Halomarina halobia TaxID=3033386 RepID=A0ABD6A3N6_9EURY|nr:hypothetical protein [Halomarina sp. PSR21]